MIVIFKKDAPQEAIQALCRQFEAQGLKIHNSMGEHTHLVGLIGDTSAVDADLVRANAAVEEVKRVSEPYKKANRKFHPGDTVVKAGGAAFGGGHFSVIAGPCSVESAPQIELVAKSVQASGAAMLRGGAFKPRTSPYAFQGLRADGLVLLRHAREKTGLPIVTEIMNPEHIPLFEDVDLIQVGARNMQNFELLKELGTAENAYSAQARACQHAGGVFDERRVYHGGRQRKRHSVRARHPHLRAKHAQHAGHFCRAHA